MIFARRVAAMAVSFAGLVLLVFLFLFLFSSEEFFLNKGEEYNKYGFRIKNLGDFTVAEYGNREIAEYIHSNPSADFRAAEEFSVSEDIKLTMKMFGKKFVYGEIKFNRIGILWKKIRRMF